MQAIELTANIDAAGFLKFLTPLPIRSAKPVRVIILYQEEDEITDEVWLQATRSPAFDFLLDPAEDIYTLDDGQPIAQK